jgi:glycosyltransferase involved in cell wall biosynthesis
VGNVYHGLPRDLLPFTANPKGDYLAFLGRISPEKGPDRAIEIAARAGMKLKIAAKIDRVDRAYWDETVAPMIAANPNVEYIGEINEPQKSEFLGNARALLFPIDWPEPFGLVMIEAMACGTPVVAFRCGSVPEVLTPGRSGMIVDTVDEAVAALAKIETMDRSQVRACFEKRFTVERMAQDYLAVYRSLSRPRTDAARIYRPRGDEKGLQAVA